MAKSNSQPGKRSAKVDSIRAPLISLLLALGALLLLVFVFLPMRESSSLELETRKLAENQAHMVGLSLSQFQQHLQGLSKSAAVLQVLNEPGTENVAAQSQWLSKAFPQASSVQLLPIDRMGITGLSRYNISLRNNIESNMVARAEDGDAVAAEAYSVNDKVEFSLAHSITHPSSGKVVGILIARLPGELLDEAMTPLDAQWGKSQLVQSYRNKDMPISEHGNSVYTLDANSAEAIRVEVPGSIWHMAFAPGPQLESSTSVTRWPLWLNFGIPALLIGLWHFFTQRMRERKPSKELKMLTEFIHDFGAGKTARPPVIGNERMNAVADAVVEMRRKIGQEAKPTKAVKAAAAAGDEAVNDALDIQDAPTELPDVDAPANIFRAYDIRGDAENELTDDVAYAIGMAIGSEAQAGGQSDIAVAADGRNSSPRIKAKINAGLVASGMHIIDIGEQPTPVLYFATEHLETAAGVMITGSHNGAECNGVKLVLDGRPLSG